MQAQKCNRKISAQSWAFRTCSYIRVYSYMVGYKWNKSTIQYLIWLPISSKSPFISYEEKGFWFVVSFDKIIKKRSFLSILLWPKNWKKILTLCSSVCIVILQDSQWCCWVTWLGQFASFDFLISAENAHFCSSYHMHLLPK